MSASVLIVNYKSYDDLDVCLRSLEETGALETAEIIVVDNASDAEMLSGVIAGHPRVQFVARQDNRGFASGVNDAARRARGEFLLLLNPDAAVLPGAIDSMTQFLDEQPAVGVVGGRVYDPDGSVQRSARAFPSLTTAFFGRTSLLTSRWPNNPASKAQLVADESTKEAKDVDWVAGSYMMVRADAFRAAGGMDEAFFMYWEDADLCRRLRSAGWRIVYLPNAGVVHHVGRSSRHARARSIVAFHRSAFRYYSKHRRGLSRVIVVPIAAAGLYGRMIVKLAAAFVETRLRVPPASPRAAMSDWRSSGKRAGSCDESQLR